MADTHLPEPWLRATFTDVAPLQRAVLHALELAKEDLEKWCGNCRWQSLSPHRSRLFKLLWSEGSDAYRALCKGVR